MLLIDDILTYLYIYILDLMFFWGIFRDSFHGFVMNNKKDAKKQEEIEIRLFEEKKLATELQQMTN